MCAEFQEPQVYEASLWGRLETPCHFELRQLEMLRDRQVLAGRARGQQLAIPAPADH